MWYFPCIGVRVDVCDALVVPKPRQEGRGWREGQDSIPRTSFPPPFTGLQHTPPPLVQATHGLKKVALCAILIWVKVPKVMLPLVFGLGVVWKEATKTNVCILFAGDRDILPGVGAPADLSTNLGQDMETFEKKRTIQKTFIFFGATGK